MYAEELVVPEVAAAALRISPRTLEAWRSRGEGPAYVRVGRRVVYARSDLAAWLRERRVQPGHTVDEIDDQGQTP